MGATGRHQEGRARARVCVGVGADVCGRACVRVTEEGRESDFALVCVRARACACACDRVCDRVRTYTSEHSSFDLTRPSPDAAYLRHP